jgi:ketosteroid isomerase-like protein
MDTIRRLSLTFLTLASFCLLSACGEGVQPDARTLANAKDDIAQLNAAFTKAFDAKDASGVANAFTDDGILMPPNQAAVKSAIAIQTYARESLVAPISGILMNADETEVAGDWAYCYGYYSILGAGNATMDRGKFVEVLKHTDAGWKISRYIYNSDLPMAPSAYMAPTAAPAAATH